MKDFVDPDSEFFVSFSGAPLADNSNTRGSLWSKFEDVTGVVRATPNTLRRGVEHVVQHSPNLSKRSRDLTGHSLEVGDKVYNKNADQVRTKLVHKLAIADGLSLTEEDKVEDEEIKAKRQKLEKEDEDARQQLARETMKLYSPRRAYTQGKGCKLLPVDRGNLQKIFSKKEHSAISGVNSDNKFPGTMSCNFEKFETILNFFQVQRLGKCVFIGWLMGFKMIPRTAKS